MDKLNWPHIALKLNGANVAPRAQGGSQIMPPKVLIPATFILARLTRIAPRMLHFNGAITHNRAIIRGFSGAIQGEIAPLTMMFRIKSH